MSGTGGRRAVAFVLGLLAVAVALLAFLAPLAFPEPGPLRLAWLALAGVAVLLAGGGLAFLLALASRHRRSLELPPLARAPPPAMDFDAPWKGGNP